MVTLIADVETDNLLPDMTRMWCVGIGDPETNEIAVYADQPGYSPIDEGLQRLRTAERVVFHNGFGFDFWAINKLYPGTLKPEQVFDTLIVARMWHPTGKHRLEDWGERLGFPKGDHSEFSRWSSSMAEYCGRDVEVTIKLFRRMWNEAKRHGESVGIEHKVAYILAIQEQHGFRLDVQAAQELEAEIRQEQMDIEVELQKVFPPVIEKMKSQWWVDETGKQWATKKEATAAGVKVEKGPHKTKTIPFNPGSRQQVANRLIEKYGWKPHSFTPTGIPEINESVLSELPYDEASVMNRYLRCTKMLGQVSDGDNSWLKHERNGRVHGAVNTLGARTHRMSHFAPNMAQVDKKEPRMRQCWLPDEGDKLVGCDAEGLELRMLAHYLARYDGGAYAKAVVTGSKEEGTDAHTLTQRVAGLHSRDSAKTLIYAFLYGAGNHKLGTILLDDADAAGKPRPQGKPAYLGKKVRDKLQVGITGLGRLVDTVKARHKTSDTEVYLTGLDGRQIESTSQHSSLNTLLQGAGATVMKWALVIFHERMTKDFPEVDFKYCANVHDEVQMSVPPEHAELVGQQFAESIRVAGEKLNMRVPLSGSYDIGDNWKETH